MTKDVPTIYFPRREGEPPEPVPYVLTEADVIRLMRLDETEAKHPGRTIQRYRDTGLLRGTQIGYSIRYTLPEVLAFLHKRTEIGRQ